MTNRKEITAAMLRDPDLQTANDRLTAARQEGVSGRARYLLHCAACIETSIKESAIGALDRNLHEARTTARLIISGGY